MMHWGWIVGAALLLGLVLTACRRDTAHGVDGPRDGFLGPEQVVRVLQGAVSGVETDGLLVCRDSEGWQRFWAEHTRLQLPTPPAPPVDFAEQCVLAVFCGERPSGGYSVEIDGVERMGDGLRVYARELQPEEGTAQVSMMTMPFDLVTVPRFQGPVELEWID